MRQIQELENFFELDLKVKKIIESSRPNMYNADPVVIESDLLKTVEIARIAFNQMISFAKFDVGEEFNKLLDNIKNKIEECNYNIDKLVSVYENNILKMTDGFEEKVELYIIGFSNKESPYIPLKDCRTINDMLHYLHSYVINNSDLLESMPLVEEKKFGEYDWKGYRLYGRDTEMARDIFNKLPEDESLILEVSFDGHILVMVRDRGHALSIDVQEEPNENCRVSYFIPKICNVEKINKVKGIIKVDTDSEKRSTHGEFVCKKDEIGSEINSFIKSIPNDRDMNHNEETFNLQEEVNKFIESNNQIDELLKEYPEYKRYVHDERNNFLDSGIEAEVLLYKAGNLTYEDSVDLFVRLNEFNKRIYMTIINSNNQINANTKGKKID